MTPFALAAKGDPHPLLLEAAIFISRAGFNFDMPSRDELRVGNKSYFWASEIISVDGEPALGFFGIQQFVDLLHPLATAEQENHEHGAL